MGKKYSKLLELTFVFISQGNLVGIRTRKHILISSAHPEHSTAPSKLPRVHARKSPKVEALSPSWEIHH